MTALLTIPEAASRLSIAPATLRRWAARGSVPSRKVGGAVRFSEEDVEAIIAESYRPVRGPARDDRVTMGPLKWVRMT